MCSQDKDTLDYVIIQVLSALKLLILQKYIQTVCLKMTYHSRKTIFSLSLFPKGKLMDETFLDLNCSPIILFYFIILADEKNKLITTNTWSKLRNVISSKYVCRKDLQTHNAVIFSTGKIIPNSYDENNYVNSLLQKVNISSENQYSNDASNIYQERQGLIYLHKWSQSSVHSASCQLCINMWSLSRTPQLSGDTACKAQDATLCSVSSDF